MSLNRMIDKPVPRDQLLYNKSKMKYQTNISIQHIEVG